MTEISFYTFAQDRFEVARQIVVKAYRQRRHVMLYVTDRERADVMDQLLWALPGFLPHCRDHDPLAPETPVLIGASVDTLAQPDVIINLDDERPQAFSRFARLVEIVTGAEDDRMRARQRYRFYQERGYALNTINLGQQGVQP